jgi:hypothetical protein
MKYIGIHKINGLKIYKHDNKYYLFDENADAYVHMQVLSEEQKRMVNALHSDKATILYQR